MLNCPTTLTAPRTMPLKLKGVLLTAPLTACSPHPGPHVHRTPGRMLTAAPHARTLTLTRTRPLTLTLTLTLA